MKTSRLISTLGASLLLSGFCIIPAHAASVSDQGSWSTTLQARDLDGNTATIEGYYDTVLGITWLANANYAGTSMSWDAAISWVAGLNINGISGWRLPDTGPVNGIDHVFSFAHDGSTDLGYNISAAGTVYAGSTGSELAYMFYNTLGNIAYYDTAGTPGQAGWGLSNSGPFANLQDYFYWSVTRYTPDTSKALGLGFNLGRQNEVSRGNLAYAWAVHTGDIGLAVISTAVVPLPAAAWLFGSGLLGLLTIARRKQAA